MTAPARAWTRSGPVHCARRAARAVSTALADLADLLDVADVADLAGRLDLAARAVSAAPAVLVALAGCVFPTAHAPASERPLVIGSKAFTESVILGEIVVQQLESAGVRARHLAELGGSRVLFDALLRGEIDAYPEYSGTLLEELLSRDDGETASLDMRLEALGLAVAVRFGFENNYVLGARPDLAATLGLTRIGDLAAHPQLRFGFSNEFMQRADGWPGLRRHYGLPQRDVRGMAHALAYRGLASGALDVTDLYSTDPEIVRYGIAVLADDRGFFPRYEALLLVRAGFDARALTALATLEGALDAERMAALNARATLERVPERTVAHGFLATLDEEGAAVREASLAARVAARTGEHLLLSGVSLLAALLVGLPLGILAARHPLFGRIALGTAGLVQTIPSLALLVFMIPLLGIGFVPAVVALFLYSLLPIVRNTCAGLLDIPRPLRESALALGLGEWARLRLVELPLAARAILAGMKTAAVINVGTATLGALIGAGGYGQPILSGIRRNDVAMILEGAIPAAVLALLIQGAFDLAERRLIRRSAGAPARAGLAG